MAEEEKEKPVQDQMKRMVEMAKLLKDAQAKVERLGKELVEAKKVQQELEQEDFPELMKEVGVTSFQTADGEQFILTEEISCGITKDNHKAAMEWLDKNKFGGLIKTLLEVSFAREDREHALRLAELLQNEAASRQVQIEPEVSESVHAATLKSFIKEEMEKGHAVPNDLFSIHPYNKVKVVESKNKKK